MKTNKGRTRKTSDTDKAIARPGLEAPVPTTSKIPSNISLDTVIAEKDEVKNAEEKLRRKTNKEK